MKYFISVSYDGSKFYGFQRLKGKKTVQNELEEALMKINKKEVLVKGAGRTDRGVHALDQGVSFDLDINIPPERLVVALNSILRPYINVNWASYVDHTFHARFSVKKKTYVYVINLGEFDTIRNDYLYNYNRMLNVRKMRKCAKLFLGGHNFINFTAGVRENYDSIIYKVNLKEKDNYLVISFTGKSFYRYMVRNMVGFLIAVGEGKLKEEDLKNYFTSEKINTGYTTAPAEGLYLDKIEY